MKRILLFSFVMLLGISLVGCNDAKGISEDKQDEGGSSSTSQGSLHNYAKEALSKALSKHPEFPNLQLDQKKTKMVPVDDKKMKVSFSSIVNAKPFGGGVKNLKNGNKKWSEATDAIWIVTLKKVWHRNSNKANVESRWKYKYNPNTDKVKIIENDNNDSKIKG